MVIECLRLCLLREEGSKDCSGSRSKLRAGLVEEDASPKEFKVLWPPGDCDYQVELRRAFH